METVQNTVAAQAQAQDTAMVETYGIDPKVWATLPDVAKVAIAQKELVIAEQAAELAKQRAEIDCPFDMGLSQYGNVTLQIRRTGLIPNMGKGASMTASIEAYRAVSQWLPLIEQFATDNKAEMNRLISLAPALRAAVKAQKDNEARAMGTARARIADIAVSANPADFRPVAR